MPCRMQACKKLLISLGIPIVWHLRCCANNLAFTLFMQGNICWNRAINAISKLPSMNVMQSNFFFYEFLLYKLCVLPTSFIFHSLFVLHYVPHHLYTPHHFYSSHHLNSAHHLYSPYHFWGCPHGIMVKTMDCRIVVSEFVLQLRYYVHFWANTLGKYPLILQAMGQIVPLLFFSGNSFGIK